MSKQDEKIEEIVEHVIDSKMLKLMRWICGSAISVFLAMIYSLGGMVYDKWEKFSAAIDAFIRTGK